MGDQSVIPAPSREIELARSRKWFAPLVGLRSRSKWIGLIGLEIEPDQPHASQRPVWKILRWNPASNEPANGISGIFNYYWNPSVPDHRRYPGRWFPAEDAQGPPEHAQTYIGSQVTSLKGFDQIVFLSWSEGVPHHQPDWHECAIILAKGGHARQLNPLKVEVDGAILLPVGLPDPKGEGEQTAAIRAVMTAYETPGRGGDSEYAEFFVEAAGLRECDTCNWNGYGGQAGPFQGIARFGLNGRLSSAGPIREPGHPGEVLARRTFEWPEHPDSDRRDYRVELNQRRREIEPTDDGGQTEARQRSYVLVGRIDRSSIGSSTTRSAVWDHADFSQWFRVTTEASDHLYSLVTEVDHAAARDLLEQHSINLPEVMRDGTLGDPVSFYPAVSNISPIGTQSYRINVRYSGVLAPAPEIEFSVASDSVRARVRAEFTRFAKFSRDVGERAALSAEIKAVLLPRFIGRHGLDVELWVLGSALRNGEAFVRPEGSLTLTFAAGAVFPRPTTDAEREITSGSTHGYFRLGSRLPEGFGLSKLVTPYFQVREFRLPVESIAPFSRDLLASDLLSSIDEDETSDFLEAPILLPLGDAGGANNITLEVNETCEPPRVRNLRMELLRDPLDRGPLFGTGRFLVLDRTPFLAAIVELPSLAQNDGFNSGVVVRRVIDVETGQPIWELAMDTSDPKQAVKVILPAQAIGEEALLLDKASPDDYFSYRFGSVAQLELAPTYRTQRYAPIPWNLRRLFGYPGQRDPGAEVRRMEFELLYGLEAIFSARDADKLVRVAELFARLGSLPGGLPTQLPWKPNEPQRTAWTALRGRWRAASRRFAARLAVLEPWSPADREGLVLDKGLKISPRVIVDERGVIRGAQLHYPPERLDDLSPEVRQLHHRKPEDGLPGGFSWGMQEWEAPFVELFWKNRRSSSAEVRDLRFSSRGGSGHQIARFAGNRLTFESRTGYGNTHVYTVERIGKISVWGHKAKHVIRYERSVVPSPFGTLDGQQRFAGRPVLRKMEEYIELIQDRRDYPDRASGVPLDTGTVRACYFSGRGARIPIRGSWGVAKNRLGKERLDWEVPLWRANAQADLFPKPEIFVEMISGTGDQARAIAQTIANPEDVYFFTTAEEGLTDDVDAWPIVEGADYLNIEEPTEWNDEETFPDQDTVPDDGWPDAIAIPPGLERFTFRLDPSEDEVNVVANRREDVMLHGRIRNVTMMRCAPRPKPALTADDPTPRMEWAEASAKAQRKWQRKTNLGLGAVRKLLTTNPRGATPETLRVAVETATRNFPWIHKVPPPREGEDDVLAGAICEGRRNPILARTIALLIREAADNLQDRGTRLFESALAPVTDQLNQIETAQGALREALVQRVDDAIEKVGNVLFFVEFGPDRLLETFDTQVDHSIAAARERVEQMIDLAVNRLEELAALAEQWVGANVAQAQEAIDTVIARVTQAATRAQEILNSIHGATAPLPQAVRDKVRLKIAELRDVTIPALRDTVNTILRETRLELGANANAGAAAIAEVLRRAAQRIRRDGNEAVQRLESTVLTLRREVRAEIEGGLQDLKDLVEGFLETIRMVLGWLRKEITSLGDDAEAVIKEARIHVSAAENALKAKLATIVEEATCRLDKLLCPLADFELRLPDVVQDGLGAIKEFGAIRDSLEALYDFDYGNPQNWPKALDELDAIERRLGVETSWMGRELTPAIRKILPVAESGHYVAQEASTVLRGIRTVCNDLRTDGLGLNRKTVALILNYKAPTINLTPTLARLNQFGQQLGALGIRLPTLELGDRFLPDPRWLKNFDFNRILSDCGGVRLAGLLRRVKFPKGADERLRVTQGLDKRTLRAWVLAQVDVPLSGRQNLFDFGPVSVLLENAEFKATVRSEVDAGGQFRKDARGEIRANWVLTTGGQELVAFERTRLTFVNGKMNFDLNPKNVRLGGLLKILSDLTQTLPMQGGEDDPLQIAWLKENLAGYEIPVGVRATLELPSSDVGTTPIAVTGLQLGGFLELRALQKDRNELQFDFTVAIGVHLSRKDKPFNVAIYCLGGGGWVDAALTYRPSQSYLSAHITVGLVASASLSFNLGWLSGGVGIYLGIFIEYHHSKREGSSFGIGMMILLEGCLDLLGIVEVYLSILLEAIYRVAGSQKTLECRGTVSVRIKICWCFTLKVRRSFTYKMGGGGGGGNDALRDETWRKLRSAVYRPLAVNAAPAAGDYETAAADYLAMFADNPA